MLPRWLILLAGMGLGVMCTPLPTATQDFGPDTFVALARKASPAVVNIDVVRRVSVETPEVFAPFFGRRGPITREEQGVGSGFIVRPDGYIATNHHVVAGRAQLIVTLTNGRHYPATVVGQDPPTDLAVIRIAADNLPVLPWAPPATIQVGQWCMAIGSPFGFETSVTAGVVGGLNREVPISERVAYLQTDAAINPGNSGGPLLDLAGRVIGVNTAVIQGASGLGFAIPVGEAQRVVQELIQHGKVVRPWLGVAVRDLPEALQEQFPKATSGALVVEVVAGGPAAQAGLRPGDLITAVEGQAVANGRQLIDKVSRYPIGKTVALTVHRQNQVVNCRVTLRAMPPS